MKRLRFDKLLEQNEGVFLDWKVKLPDGFTQSEKQEAQGNLIRDLCALANTRGEASRYLVYGVHDQQTTRYVVGIDLPLPFDESVVQQWSESYLDQPLNFEMTSLDYDGKTVLIFDILPPKNGPHMPVKTIGKLIEGQVVYRLGSKNTVATGEVLRNFFTGGTDADIIFGTTSAENRGKEFFIQEYVNSELAHYLGEMKPKLETALHKVLQEYQPFDSLQRNRTHSIPTLDMAWSENENRAKDFLVTLSGIHSLRLSVTESATLEEVLGICQLDFDDDILNPIDARGPWVGPSLWGKSYPTASEGTGKNWFNALISVLEISENFLYRYKEISSWRKEFPLWICLENTGETALEGIKLEIEVKNLEFISNENGKGEMRGIVRVSDDDRRRFEVHPKKVIARLDMLSSGATEVFFGASLFEVQEKTLLECKITAKPLTKPLFVSLYIFP